MCILVTWNLTEGPEGDLAAQRYKSLCLRASKKMQLVQPFKSATSLMIVLSDLVSSLASFLECGRSCIKSSMRWRNLNVETQKRRALVRIVRFFKSFACREILT